jgi:methionyl aminopeptidase
MTVSIKTPEQIEKMRVAGKLAADVLEMIEPFVKVGITTGELDRICHEYITQERDAIPAPLNYHGFPKSICTSINHVICHGIPSDSKKLKDGDILNIDITVIKDGFHGDTSKMFYLGNVPNYMKKLAERSQLCLYKALEIVKPGTTLGDIGAIIQQHAEKKDGNGVSYSIVQEYCGHGIGEVFHEEPQVLHYGIAGQGLALKEGMTFTIEPMLNAGKRHTKLNNKDGWTVTTKDGKPSAQWEHTIVVTADGCEILTARQEELDAFSGCAVFRQD